MSAAVREGMDALGHPVPEHRLTNAYKLLKEWHYDTETAMRIVGRIAHHIEEDEPFKAQKIATGGAPLPLSSSSATEPFDYPTDLPPFNPGVTGGLRLYAVLLASNEAGA